jgi:uncharacterized protein (DUF1684 family)
MAADTYVDAIGHARAERVTRLRQMDGYLSLTASGWLEPGDNTIGSAADNDLNVPGAPAHMGVLTLAGGQVRLHLLATDGIGVVGRTDTPRDIELHTQGAAGRQTPTRVRFGSSYLYLVENGSRRGLRVKDNDAPLRTHFPGFDYFPIDPSWRIEAKWQPFDPPGTLKIAYVTGTVEDTPIPGKAVFQRGGRTYELQPIAEDGRLFFIFSDRTAGKLTYGGARFLYADAPKDGKVLLDFNLAENPPCAITPHVVCPLAPPQNRLKLPVTAGELKFRGAGH